MAALEKHFTVGELAELWSASDDTIRNLFKNEPGVLRLGSPEKMHARQYISLRIPQSVAERVHKRLSRGEA